MKKFNELNDEQLRQVAEHYNINGYSNMNRKELIDYLTRILPEHGASQKKRKPDVRMKLTRRTIIYNIMFISCILISFISSLTVLIEKFYFYPTILKINPLNDIYGLILTLLTVVWGIYIYTRWLKTGVFHIYMIISTLLALGFFIYYCINDYRNIVVFASSNHSLEYQIFTIYFYLKIAIMAALCLSFLTTFILRNI